jgi:hypothetical protein
MTHVTTGYPSQEVVYEDADVLTNGEFGSIEQITTAPVADGPVYIPRSRWLAVPFILPIFLSGISYIGGGVPFLTDAAMILLAILCVVCTVRELAVFPFRYGIGGLIVFVGTPLWFSYDYFKHWMGISFTGSPFEPWVVAKAAFYHTVFVFFMILGLRIRGGRWLERIIQSVPEPRSKSFYFLLVLLIFLIGMLPFLLFTAEPFYVSIWKAIWAGRSGQGAELTVGRTGYVNYSWGGYVAQLADVGMMGAVLAAFYTIMVRPPLWQKPICWGIWALWLAISFGTGTRGFVVFMAMPVAMLVFLKYNFRATELMRRVSLRAYAGIAILGLTLLTLIQVQAQFRNTGFDAETFQEVDVAKLEGNEMFSTTLIGMQAIPARKDFFYGRFPGEGALRAIPQEIYKLVIGPVPRALWTSKPIDPVWAWYNGVSVSGNSETEGTTISNGAVGHPYIRYGPIGVIEFGLLYGWMMAVCERSLLRAAGRPMAILFTLAFATFLFRSYRDLWWNNLYPVMIAGVLLWIIIRAGNFVFAGPATEAA